MSQTHILTITNGEPTERYDMREHWSIVPVLYE